MKITPTPAASAVSETRNGEQGTPDTLAASDPQASFVQALKRARANAPRKPEKTESEKPAGDTSSTEPAANGTEDANERTDPTRRMAVPDGSQPVSYPGLPGQPVTWPGTPAAQAWLAAGQAGTGKGPATTDAPVLALPGADEVGGEAAATAALSEVGAAAIGSHAAAAARRGGSHAAGLQQPDPQVSPTAELAAQTEAASGREGGNGFAEALRAVQPAGGAASASAATPASAATAAAAALQAAQGLSPSPADAGGLVATATLAVPVNEAGFAPALASQLTTFLRDGVQQAELNLNPAELGPVRVSIAVEGTQAQVEFSASQALTRVALEQSLPALASALHQAGFTLTGGGVSDQRPREQGSRGEGTNVPGNPDRTELGSTGARTGASARRSNHLLDQFA